MNLFKITSTNFIRWLYALYAAATGDESFSRL